MYRSRCLQCCKMCVYCSARHEATAEINRQMTLASGNVTREPTHENYADLAEIEMASSGEQEVPSDPDASSGSENEPNGAERCEPNVTREHENYTDLAEIEMASSGEQEVPSDPDASSGSESEQNGAERCEPGASVHQFPGPTNGEGSDQEIKKDESSEPPGDFSSSAAPHFNMEWNLPMGPKLVVRLDLIGPNIPPRIAQVMRDRGFCVMCEMDVCVPYHWYTYHDAAMDPLNGLYVQMEFKGRNILVCKHTNPHLELDRCDNCSVVLYKHRFKKHRCFEDEDDQLHAPQDQVISNDRNGAYCLMCKYYFADIASHKWTYHLNNNAYVLEDLQNQWTLLPFGTAEHELEKCGYCPRVAYRLLLKDRHHVFLPLQN